MLGACSKRLVVSDKPVLQFTKRALACLLLFVHDTRPSLPQLLKRAFELRDENNPTDCNRASNIFLRVNEKMQIACARATNELGFNLGYLAKLLEWHLLVGCGLAYQPCCLASQCRR